jgi:hypothetical protein
MFQTSDVKKNQNRILYSVSFPENLAVYEIMWKNMAGAGQLQLTI